MSARAPAPAGSIESTECGERALALETAAEKASRHIHDYLWSYHRNDDLLRMAKDILDRAMGKLV